MENTHNLPKAYLTKRCKFSASHRLHSLALSDEENLSIFGKCNSRNGHGHNYTAEVTLHGPISPTTGMVHNLSDVKKDLQVCIMDVFDHRNIDLDVEYFRTVPSTAENIARNIWQRLRSHMGANGHLLYEIKLFETEDNIVIYRGE